MKALIISDIHGIKTNLYKIKDKFRKLSCDKLIVLGDLYYSSNEKDYDPQYVRNFLKSFKTNLICIKGNCDFHVINEEEPFKIQKDNLINIESNIYITHGNKYNEANWPLNNSILIFGHYHFPFIKQQDSNIYINPGSISKPRGNNKPSYLFMNDKEFTIYDIDDVIIGKIKVK